MKAFRTEINPDKPNWTLSHHDQILMMGSCFSEHIGNRLIHNLYNIDCNPFGILFNPVSIAAGIQRLINQEPYTIEDLFVQNGLWHSFDHHGKFSGTDPVEVLEKINLQLAQSAAHLKETNRLFLTFGTARVYQFLKTGRVVSNCHKVPANEFQVQLLRVGDVVRLYTRILQELEQVTTDLKVRSDTGKTVHTAIR